MKELKYEELKELDGGSGWPDLFWMAGEKLVVGWVELSKAMNDWQVANPEQATYYRALHH
ncbi:hypothetical protein [Prolixibacter sp. SD074]|jgi:hypothetical protein|uniref:hypothetical protein n=1 Tax=Prolixibacter sp. SD074 TaxID=2652391 RepID=UPI001284FFFB|nr:hypothetical protein [Prolixibacter sp. SD074]GET30044.1 hypothetical protein SD074_22460 [Prolixibacter sp. SD074]